MHKRSTLFVVAALALLVLAVAAGPAVAAPLFFDNFNRSAVSIPDGGSTGLWTPADISAGNSLSIVGSPALPGGFPAGALKSVVTNLSPEFDNANLEYTIPVGRSESFISAYVYLPSGQNWDANHACGLLRLNQTETSAHIRLSAYQQTWNTFQIKVNWKTTGNAYGPTDYVVATGLSFGQWHWIQLHVKNSPAAGQPGEVQTWVDGRPAYQQNTIFVQNTGQHIFEAGIMHNTSTGPASTTITDDATLNNAYVLNTSNLFSDNQAPTGVVLTSPAAGTITGTATFSANASDNNGVQRVDFLMDGNVIASDDYAPYSVTMATNGLANGAHTFAAKAYDTFGNSTTSSGVSATINNQPPVVNNPLVSPNPFSPNGDGVYDLTYVTFTTVATNAKVVVSITTKAVGGTQLHMLKSTSNMAAGAVKVSWDGTYYDSATKTYKPQADGTYNAHIVVTGTNNLVTTIDLPVTINRALENVARSPVYISPNGDGSQDTTTISYQIITPAKVRVQIEDTSANVVKVLQAFQGSDQAVGTYGGIVWDGKNAANAVVPDGSYVLRVTAQVAGIGSVDVLRSLVVDTVKPVVTIGTITPNPWNGVGVVTIPVTASEAGSASSIKLYLGAASSSTRSLTAVSFTAAGTKNVTWDGQTSSGTAAPSGHYYVKIYFKDKAGNKATAYPVVGSFQLTR